MAKKALWGTIVGAVAAAAVAGTVALAVPAGATTPGQAVIVGATAQDNTAQDNTKLCDRLKQAETKRGAVVTRLSGDANTRGSIAWLQAKAAAATAAGDTDLAKLYTDKATLRTQVLDPLKTIDADLQAVISVKCG